MRGRTIAIVAKRRDTRRSVHEYLVRFGAVAPASADVEGAEALHDRIDAFVFFPDDLLHEEALRAFERLKKTHARAPLVVVTRDVARFETPPREGGVTRARIVVLRRPAWGWMIVDALRACFAA
jgi:hypothetical protein